MSVLHEDPEPQRGPVLVLADGRMPSPSAIAMAEMMAEALVAPLIVADAARDQSIQSHDPVLTIVDGGSVPSHDGMTRALLHAAHCPVMVTHGVPKTRPGLPLRIGVALDGHDAKDRILGAAIAFAAALCGTLTLLTVVDPDRPTAVRIADPFGVRDAFGARDAHTADYLSRAVSHVASEASTLPVDVAVLHGDAADLLTHHSTELDLIVCGSHARGRVAEALLGSVSAHLVRHAACAVLLVQPERQPIFSAVL